MIVFLTAGRTCPTAILLFVMVLLTTLASAQKSALAGQSQPTVVIENPADFTPQLVATTAISQPHIDALRSHGSTIYAAGLFDKVTAAGSTASVQVQNFVAFGSTTGIFKSRSTAGYVDPRFDGQVWAIASDGTSLYVGGDFTSVNGMARAKLVKINPITGAVDTRFNPGFRSGVVWDLRIWNGPQGTTPMLVVAGSVGNKLTALNPATGATLPYFNLGITDAIPNARGGVAVYKIAINSAGTRLAAVGNFQTVGAPFQNRLRFFMADLTGPVARLDSWYYPGFAKPCSSTSPRRIAYLQDVDFAPDDSYLVVASTGQIPLTKADIWPTGSARYHTVCDAAARFNLNDMTRPVWINYTGGDSVWAVVATGAAVYVQGHFAWLDNPHGRSSQDGGGAVRRLGIGAINPVTGRALAWNPDKPAKIGGKAFLATRTGLWVGSDSMKFAGENHRGLAFVPLPGS
jgi:hypothetical protein